MGLGRYPQWAVAARSNSPELGPTAPLQPGPWLPSSASLPGLQTLRLECDSVKGPQAPGLTLAGACLLAGVRISAWDGAWHLVGA